MLVKTCSALGLEKLMSPVEGLKIEFGWRLALDVTIECWQCVSDTSCCGASPSRQASDAFRDKLHLQSLKTRTICALRICTFT